MAGLTRHTGAGDRPVYTPHGYGSSLRVPAPAVLDSGIAGLRSSGAIDSGAAASGDPGVTHEVTTQQEDAQSCKIDLNLRL